MDRAQPGAAQVRAPRLVLAVLLTVAVYSLLWPGVTGDMRHFLVPWLDTILERGRIGAFAEPFSNYTPPYLYLLALFSPLAALVGKVSAIKALSVAATLTLALAARHLLRVAGSARAGTAALWLVLLPSVALNGAGFGQCDSLWSAACLMAVASAIQRRPVPMLLWFGVGIAFKAQAVFLAPFILQRLIAERAPLAWWPLPGLVYAAAMLPAALAGWPVLDLATVYLRQAAWNPDFISNAANPWALVQHLAPAAGKHWLWLGHVAAAAAAGGYVLALHRRSGDAASIVALALLSALLLPFLLPKMHERFFFLADVLAFLLFMLVRDRRTLGIFLLVQGASVLALAGLLWAQPLAPMAGAVLVLGAMLLLVRAYITRLTNTAPPSRFSVIKLGTAWIRSESRV